MSGTFAFPQYDAFDDAEGESNVRSLTRVRDAQTKTGEHKVKGDV